MDYLKRILFFILFAVHIPGGMLAAGLSDLDTVRLDEVIITGSIPKVNLRSLPMSISVVSDRQIRERLQSSVLTVLTEEVPGLFITQRGVAGYGVAAGAAGGMNIRGIGGAPSTGVLVLIDGHPQYMGLMGHPLADSYQSVMTERVEVVRGPASVLYGSNAMGGVINIITKKQKQDGSNLSFQSMYGSYNTLETQAGAGIKRGKLSGNVGMAYNRSDGHREDMDFEQMAVYARTGYELSNHWSTSADINGTKTFTSNPGTINSPVHDNDADVRRATASLVLENDYKKTSGGLRMYYNLGEHLINDGYRDGAAPPDYRFHSDDYMAGASLYQSYRFMEGNRTTAGVDYQRFGGKAKNVFTGKEVLLADKSINDAAAYLNIQQSLLADKMTLNAGIRYDYNEQSGSEWIPQFGVSYLPAASTVVKAIVSKGYRNPTIREMYMFPSQNPGLLPERLMNYELSLLQNLLENRLILGVNLFRSAGDNMIQTIITNGKPLNVNTGKIDNAGLEMSVACRLNNRIYLTTNYSYLNMKYKITGAPEHKLYAGGSYTTRRWTFSTGVQFIRGLFTSTGQNPQKENFTLWNARLNYKATNRLSFLLKSENLLNQKYEINAGYPMPGTTIFGGLQLNY